MRLVGKHFCGTCKEGSFVVAKITRREVTQYDIFYYWLPLYTNSKNKRGGVYVNYKNQTDKCNWCKETFEKRLKEKKIRLITKEEAFLELL